MNRPRLGFLGVGWIGRHRMEAMLKTGVVDAAAIADPSAEMAAEAAKLAPDARVMEGLGALLDLGLDGVVIATPSALHAEQSIRALKAGVAVFCQKPLGRMAQECAAVVAAARQADRLLDVDLSYRHLAAVAPMREAIAAGAIGEVYAADLVFHNAYGPDKPWFLDAEQSGGGCVIDLGIHLVDLAVWLLPGAAVAGVTARLFAGGKPVTPGAVEDHAIARLDLVDGGAFTLTCSWFLHAGCDAVISATFYGTEGAVALQNVDGSFYDFRSDLHRGTKTEVLALPPDEWGGRAAVRWAQRLAAGDRFDPAADEFVDLANVIDRIYGR